METENERETERQRLLDQSGAEADETEGEGGRFEPSSPDTYRASRRQGHGNDDERSSGEATAVEIPSLGVNSAAEILPTSLEEEGMPPRERDGVDVAEDIISHSPGGDHGPQMRLDAGVGSPMDDEREAGDASRSFEIDSSNDRIDGLPSSSPPEISTMRPMGAEAQRARRPRKTRKVSGPNMASHNADSTPNMLTSRSILEALQVAELIILPYGVLVMYNFSAAEERSVIEDVLSSGCVRGALRQDDEETEAFHYCYDPTIPAPRIFNDFFTFRASNHLLKLSLAHAIAQSTKLSVFEESMQRTLELTSHIPKELASTGELKLKRREALRLTGRLFKLRVDVNLTSNVLDTPELFWSEASLKALYDAIRDYLEIDQRVENLNERLAVANDLLEIIHEHISNEAMSKM